MKKVKFINKNGKEIEFNKKTYILNSFKTENDVNVYSSKYMLQDGETYINSDLTSRIIEVEISLIAKDDKDLVKKRNELINVLNPKAGEGTLIYSDDLKERKIECILTKIPSAQKLNFKSEKFILYFKANNPYFNSLNDSKVNIALWRGAFRFPLSIPSGGIIKGYREPNLIVNINNIGDVQTGMIIEFKASGTVVNPSFFNVNTREFIKLNRTMQGGESIKINTNLGKKKIISSIRGKETNILNYLDLESTFLQLQVGDNLYRYDAEENLNNLEVNVYFNPRYLGV